MLNIHFFPFALIFEEVVSEYLQISLQTLNDGDQPDPHGKRL